MFGPRGVGKTWLLREFFKQDSSVTILSLLKEDTYLELLSKPDAIRQFVTATKARPQWILIDEVQKVPALLATVHEILEEPKYHGILKFALTGSSSRKLKRGGSDLLAGRALVNNLYPLSFLETENNWGLNSALEWGSLPALVTSESDEIRAEILRSYVVTYLKEEIKEEQIIRKLEPFVRFLEAAAQANGELVKYSTLGEAALVDQKAVERYFEVLEDTLLGFFLPPYTRSARERALTLSKFYFFDIGVKRAIERALSLPIRRGSSEWGRSFEHYIILECVKLNSYFRKDAKLSQLRTKDGAEIDLIIEIPGKSPLCIEIKSSKIIPTTEINKLRRITQSVPKGIPIIIYDGEHERVEEGVRVVPWQMLLKEIWVDK